MKRNFMRMSWLLLPIISSCLTPVTVMRTGKSPLVDNKPQNACEQEAALALVPVESIAKAADTGSFGFYLTVESQTVQYSGYSFYNDTNPIEPVDIGEALTLIDDQELLYNHKLKLAPIERKEKVSNRWRVFSLISAAVATVGVTVGVIGLVNDDTDQITNGLIVGSGGALAQLIGLLGFVATKPNRFEQNFIETRRRVLVDSEYNLNRVVSKTKSYNQSVRNRCR